MKQLVSDQTKFKRKLAQNSTKSREDSYSFLSSQTKKRQNN